MKTERFLEAMNALPEAMILDAGERRTRVPVRRRRTLRMALIAAVIAVFLSVTAYASGGNRAGYNSSLRPGSNWTDLRYVPRAEKTMGVKLTVPEEFDNGFTFEKMELRYTDRTDADGQIVETFPELDITYTRGGARVTLTAEGEREQPYNGFWKTREYQGVTIWSRSYTYKAVPEDYQETDQDRDLRESGELMIGWGSDRIEIFPSSFAQFTLDGTLYNLLNMDGVTADELCAMAEQIIREAQ